MAQRLSVVFHAVENISARLSAIADVGNRAMSGLQRMEDTANRAFASFESGASAAEEAFEEELAATENLADALSGYSREADSAAHAAEEFANAQDMVSDSLSDMEDAADRAAQDMGDFADDVDDSGRSAEELGNWMERVRDYFRRFSRSSEEAEESVSGFGSGISGLGSLLAATGITVALKEIGQAMFDCAAQGEIFETSIAKLQTISGGGAIGQLQGEILALSNETGQAGDALADTAYNAISAGTAVEDSVAMAATASQLAVAGFTDTSSALSVLTTAVNSYGDAAGSAEHISDSLVTVQNLGVTTVAELSQQMGKAISTASAYNVSLENLESGYISITKSGINAAEGTTYLASMFNELGNAGSGISKLIQEETGQTFGQLMNDGQSVADVLGIVYEKCNQNAEAMMNLWGSAEAGKAANAIISQGLDTFNSNLDTLRNGVGVTQDAYSVMADTTAYAHNKMDNAAKNLQTTIGGQLNPTFEKLYDTGANLFTEMNDFLDKNPVVVKALTALGAGLAVVVTGITAVSLATSTQLVPAIIEFGAGLNAALGPVGWIAIAISGLTAAGVAFAAMMSDTNDETEKMTATTREQYYELQDLNTEYEEACAKYGETSEEASRLKYQVDELSAAFEENRQSVEEFIAEADALCESVSKISSEFNENMSEIKNSETGTLALIQRYEDLSAKANLTAAQEKELEAVTKKLAEKYPDMASGMENAAAGAEDYAEAMKKVCEQQAEEQSQQQEQDTYVEALMKRKELEEEIAKANENFLKEQDRVREMSFFDSLFKGDNIGEYKDKLDELMASQEENEGVIAQIEQKWNGTGEAITASADGLVTFEGAVHDAVGSVKAELEALADEYDKAYAVALASIEGQYNLWDKAEVQVTSMSSLNEALESQTQYWENYANNLDTLSGKAGSIEGLSDMLKQMDDGSEESAAALAAMANASDEQLGKMVENHQKLQEAQAKSGEEIGKLEVDFDSRMEEISNIVEKTVEKMDMEENAKTAAVQTMQGYINGINSMIKPATTAVDAVSAMVAAALGATYSGGKVTAPKPAPEPSQSTTPKPSTPTPPTPIEGDAKGTTNSEKVYIAGEEGPELIISGGGDTVFPKSETDRIISAVSGSEDNPQITNSVPVGSGNKGQLSGNAGDRTLTLKLEGSGSIGVGSGVSAEGLWDGIKNNMKQAFMSILQEECYEEGDGAYEF